jgi:hypothetical protein
MIAPAEVEYRVTSGLGWPLNVEVDPRIGWPNVPRETLDWPEHLTARLVTNDLTATTPPSSTIDIPPGPRRARFDEDEFSSPLVNDDPPAAATADRLTTASLAAHPHLRRSESEGRRRQDHNQRESRCRLGARGPQCAAG